MAGCRNQRQPSPSRITEKVFAYLDPTKTWNFWCPVLSRRELNPLPFGRVALFGRRQNEPVPGSTPLWAVGACGSPWRNPRRTAKVHLRDHACHPEVKGLSRSLRDSCIFAAGGTRHVMSSLYNHVQKWHVQHPASREDAGSSATGKHLRHLRPPPLGTRKPPAGKPPGHPLFLQRVGPKISNLNT